MTIQHVEQAPHPIQPLVHGQLEAVPGPSIQEWPSDVVESLEESLTVDENDAPPLEAQADPSYASLIARIDQRGQPRRPNGVVRTDYPRSAAARRAVLIRSGGRCESPRCTDMPADKSRRGQPILEVDHIEDLARGGEDHPRNMVALCPNCHACKTRGSNPAQWRRDLMRVATAAHKAAIGLADNQI
jgi:5-methylcytosine-specific restriction protein A